MNPGSPSSSPKSIVSTSRLSGKPRAVHRARRVGDFARMTDGYESVLTPDQHRNHRRWNSIRELLPGEGGV